MCAVRCEAPVGLTYGTGPQPTGGGPMAIATTATVPAITIPAPIAPPIQSQVLDPAPVAEGEPPTPAGRHWEPPHHHRRSSDQRGCRGFISQSPGRGRGDEAELGQDLD